MDEKYDYWYWPDVLNQFQIKQINLICEKHYNPFHEDQLATTIKTVDVKGIRWEFLKPEMHYVNDLWREKNKFIFGFNLFHTSDIDVWNFNTYDSKNNSEYELHYDGTNDYVSDIKFTGIVNISDEPYEGGEFIAFMNHGFREIPEIKTPGSSLLLNHDVLHKVSPVTKGIRKTLSYWLSGPRFI